MRNALTILGFALAITLLGGLLSSTLILSTSSAAWAQRQPTSCSAGADVQRIDRSSAGRDATKDDPFWLRCRGRRMYEDRRICGARFGYSLASRQEVKDGGESASSFKTYRGRPPQLAASFMSLLGAQSRHARRRCRCPLSGATRLIGVNLAAADCGFFPAPRARNFLGYRREFLPARGLIVRNVHIGKPRARRGVFWPPVAFVSGLFAADATRAAAFGA